MKLLYVFVHFVRMAHRSASSIGPAPASLAAALPYDAPAGLVVFLVALPLCLGISLASGAPLLSGLVAGIVGGLVLSWASGSQLSVSGPAAGLATVVLGAIQSLGSFEAFLAAGVVAGLLQLAMGAARAGVIALYFPSAVIRGMLAAIGLILILKQIPHFVGADRDYFEDMEFLQFDGLNTFSEIGEAARHVGPGSVLIGAVSLAVLLLWEGRWLQGYGWARRVPGALAVVLLAVGLNAALRRWAPALQVRPEHLVRLPVVANPAGLLASLRFPDWSALARPATYSVAFTVAIVASLESLLSVEAVDRLDPWKRRTPPNRELLAQGLGNVLSCALGGLPITAVIVRSSANIAAGGRTRLAAFVHGLLLLASLLFAARSLNLIPLSALAAVLLRVGYKLTKPALYRAQWRLGWQQFLPFVVTVAAILFTDLLKGVSIGLVVGAFFILKANAEAAYFLHREPDATDPAGTTTHLRLSEHVSFLNKASIVQALETQPPGSRVVVDGTRSEVIDYDVREALGLFRQAAPGRGVALELRGIEQVEPSVGH